ncbi:MAG: cobalamin B12-binding domain-containing protein [Desulfocucumaceae bacterium]
MKKIRMLIGILGLDQHEVGALVVAKMMNDAGMEVIYTGRFNTPETIVRSALEEDVDLIGLSCHSWEYIHYMPELIDLLKKEGADIPIVAGGSVITPSDAKSLAEMGVSAAFGPGSSAQEIIEAITVLGSGKR